MPTGIDAVPDPDFPSIANSIRDKIHAKILDKDPIVQISSEEIMQYAADVLARIGEPFTRQTCVATLLTIFENETVSDERIAQYEAYRTEHAPKVIASTLGSKDPDTVN